MKENRLMRFTVRRFGRMNNKQGQEVMGMSFGMIFSIMLIIFFILIAFIVIREFLGAKDCASVGIFVDKFKTDIKKTWNSQIDSHTFNGVLPGGITHVCFSDVTLPFKGDFEDFGYDFGLYEGKNANMFFYPTGKSCELPFHTIPQIDLERIIANQNPYCIAVDSGKVTIKVEKDLNDRFVMVRRV